MTAANDTITLTRLTATFGAEIAGFDLARAMTPERTGRLRGWLLEHGVLVFRDQPLTSAEQVALGRALGPLEPRHPMYPVADGLDEVMVVRNDPTQPPENEVWHSDLSCKPAPPFCSILKGVIIPEAGGDTLWADMRAVHRGLSAPMRTFLAGLEAEHDFHKGFQFVRDRQDSDRAMALDGVMQGHRATHPVIKPHPATGTPLLYVNPSFTTRILGLEPSESDALLGYLYRLTYDPKVQLRVRWAPGTVVLWDNWATQHYATGDHWPAEREVHRVTVTADAVAGDFQRCAA